MNSVCTVCVTLLKCHVRFLKRTLRQEAGGSSIKGFYQKNKVCRLEEKSGKHPETYKRNKNKPQNERSITEK